MKCHFTQELIERDAARTPRQKKSRNSTQFFEKKRKNYFHSPLKEILKFEISLNKFVNNVNKIEVNKIIIV